MKGYFLEKDLGNYSYKRADETLKLFFARYGNWTRAWKGKLAATLVYKDDEYTITFRSKRTVTLDVGELAELVLLAKAYDHTANHGVFNRYTHVAKVPKEKA